MHTTHSSVGSTLFSSGDDLKWTRHKPRLMHALPTSASAPKPPHIAVVGGGVIGLTSTLHLLQRHPTATVTLIAHKLAAETTSEGAGGLWKPFALSGTSPDKINRWGEATFRHYLDLYRSPHQDPSVTGIFMCPAYELYEHKEPDPTWKDIVPSYRRLSASEIAQYYDPSQRYSYGFAYDTIIAEGRLYMQWVLNKILETQRVIDIQRRTIQKLDEVLQEAPYDAVLNCTGLGARELANDPLVHAIRGHVVRVRAPWVKYHVEAGQGDDVTHIAPAYIIPNGDTVVLGGTKQIGDEDTRPRKEDREGIMKRCIAAVPSLAAGEVVGEWVGLRPGRTSVRVEVDGQDPRIVHNYGHGGSGLTLAWGCAQEVVNVLECNGILLLK